MPSDYDATLLEAVSVRRRRLRDAIIWGRLRTRRSLSDGLARLAIGIILAAVLSAGCVGFSFLRHALSTQKSLPAAVSILVGQR